MTGPQRHVALFTHRWSDGAPTGMGRHAHGLAQGLAEVLADGSAPGWRVTATSAAEADPGQRLPPAIGYQPLRGPRKARLAGWRLLGRPRVDGALGRPDLVHSLLPFVPVPTGAPFVQTVPDTIPLRHPEWHRWFERWGFAGGFDRLGAADAVVVSSQHVADQVCALGIDAGRIAVVPLGIDGSFFEAIAPEVVAATAVGFGVDPGRFLVAVGQVSNRKNVAVVLEALAELPPTGGVELLVVGPDGDGDLVATAARHGVGERVRATGYVTEDDLRALLQGARALLHPSTEEGFGLTPLEAMASGTPAVVAGASSLPEVVGDAGVVVDPADVTGWAAAIERVREDGDLVTGIVAAGRERAATYTWRATAKGHLDVWAAVLDGRTPKSV